jgi:hypothetical protein
MHQLNSWKIFCSIQAGLPIMCTDKYSIIRDLNKLLDVICYCIHLIKDGNEEKNSTKLHNNRI